MSCRISSGDFGRPPRGLDFQRQYARKPARCQRITVSGLTIFKASSTPGANRYNPANTRRSMLLKVSYYSINRPYDARRAACESLSLFYELFGYGFQCGCDLFIQAIECSTGPLGGFFERLASRNGKPLYLAC